MGTRKIRNLPAGLERLRQRFECSRRVRRARSRIPDSLWAAAVTMAKTYGVNRTAKTLRLDYYVLKNRVQQDTVAIADPPEKADATFVELAPSLSLGVCQCNVDLESAGGATMRIQLKSITMPDLVALSQSFWNRQP